jgi:hypothetical protein
MQKSVWGPATWKLLHTMVLKINNDASVTQINDLKSILLRIVSNLPCPYCTSHAVSYFTNSNYKLIQNITDLRYFIFTFHNNVNKRLNKPVITYEEHLQLYNIPLRTVALHFFEIYTTKNTGVTMMLYNFHRKNMIHDLRVHFKNNQHLYNFN